MRLYFIRHGESEANLLMEFSNSSIKHPLTALGQEQAQSVAQSLSGLQVDRVYTSPVLRAVQTAEVIGVTLAAPLEITGALREWSVGDYEGTQDPAGWALHRQVQEDWFWHGRLESKMPGGESFLEIQARFVPFIERLINRADLQDREVVLVAHGGLYLAMLPVILKNIDHDFALQHGYPNTGVTIAVTRTDGLWCESWCGIEMSS
jgi:probable phosphoglycerate mutase